MKIHRRLKWFLQDTKNAIVESFCFIGYMVWFLSCMAVIMGIVGFGAWGFLKVCHVF